MDQIDVLPDDYLSRRDTETPLYDADIDFTSAEHAWRQNKRRGAHGSGLVYCCGATRQCGKTCHEPCLRLRRSKREMMQERFAWMSKAEFCAWTPCYYHYHQES